MSTIMKAPAEFLRPNASEQAKLRQEQERKEREKKKRAQERTLARKKVKAEEDEKKAEIEKAVEEDRLAAIEASKSSDQLTVEAYLKKKPYFGNSLTGYVDKDCVKALCAGNGEQSYSRWDPKLKKWGTTSLSQVIKLVRSGLWFPVGLHGNLRNTLLKTVNQMLHAEMVSAEALSEQKRAAAQDKAGIKVLTEEEKQELEEDRARRAMYAAATVEEEEQCAQAGFSLQAVTRSVKWETLGPSDTSSEFRLLRILDLYAAEDEAYKRPKITSTRTRLVECINAHARNHTIPTHHEFFQLRELEND